MDFMKFLDIETFSDADKLDKNTNAIHDCTADILPIDSKQDNPIYYIEDIEF